MNRRAPILAAFLLALLVLTVLFVRTFRPSPAPALNAQPSTLNSPAPASSPSPISQLPSPKSAPADFFALSALNSPATDIAADLRLLADAFESYRVNFPATGNPVGDNPDIVAALAGRNPHRLVLLPPDHPAIDAAGRLCDRWGTPFFFHALSGTQMEIRSAGPDKKLHTPDDTVLTP